MKKLIALTLLFTSFTTFAQDHLVRIELDGKPAILNTKTGETTLSNGKMLNAEVSSYSNTNSSVNTNDIDLIATHVVQKGETLYSISKKYQISMSQIKAINNLKSNILGVNQELRIGYLNTAEINDSSWTVVKGDTLYSISKQTGVSISQIKSLNNLDSNLILVGQKLSIK